MCTQKANSIICVSRENADVIGCLLQTFLDIEVAVQYVQQEQEMQEEQDEVHHTITLIIK